MTVTPRGCVVAGIPCPVHGAERGQGMTGLPQGPVGKEAGAGRSVQTSGSRRAGAHGSAGSVGLGVGGGPDVERWVAAACGGLAGRCSCLWGAGRAAAAQTPRRGWAREHSQPGDSPQATGPQAGGLGTQTTCILRQAGPGAHVGARARGSERSRPPKEFLPSYRCHLSRCSSGGGNFQAGRDRRGTSLRPGGRLGRGRGREGRAR